MILNVFVCQGVKYPAEAMMTPEHNVIKEVVPNSVSETIEGAFDFDTSSREESLS